MTNAQLAKELTQLHDILLLGGYDESHVAPYARLSYRIARLPVSAALLQKEGRLAEIPGVGPAFAALLSEYLLTGTCKKRLLWEQRVPKGVLQLLAIPGVGVKTASLLYRKCGIESLEDLEKAVRQGTIPRIDTRTATTLRGYFLSKIRAQETLSLFAEAE